MIHKHLVHVLHMPSQLRYFCDIRYNINGWITNEAMESSKSILVFFEVECQLTTSHSVWQWYQIDQDIHDRITLKQLSMPRVKIRTPDLYRIYLPTQTYHKLTRFACWGVVNAWYESEYCNLYRGISTRELLLVWNVSRRTFADCKYLSWNVVCMKYWLLVRELKS